MWQTHLKKMTKVLQCRYPPVSPCPPSPPLLCLHLCQCCAQFTATCPSPSLSLFPLSCVSCSQLWPFLHPPLPFFPPHVSCSHSHLWWCVLLPLDKLCLWYGERWGVWRTDGLAGITWSHDSCTIHAWLIDWTGWLKLLLYHWLMDDSQSASCLLYDRIDDWSLTNRLSNRF
jgi:hypothetical protein